MSTHGPACSVEGPLSSELTAPATDASACVPRPASAAGTFLGHIECGAKDHAARDAAGCGFALCRILPSLNAPSLEELLWHAG